MANLDWGRKKNKKKIESIYPWRRNVRTDSIRAGGSSTQQHAASQLLTFSDETLREHACKKEWDGKRGEERQSALFWCLIYGRFASFSCFFLFFCVYSFVWLFVGRRTINSLRTVGFLLSLPSTMSASNHVKADLIQSNAPQFVYVRVYNIELLTFMFKCGSRYRTMFHRRAKATALFERKVRWNWACHTQIPMHDLSLPYGSLKNCF